MTLTKQPTGLQQQPLSASSFSLQQLADHVLTSLNGNGWTIIRNFAEGTSLAEQRTLFVELCQLIGKPVGHDRDGKIVWDIKSRHPSKDAHAVVTFSEHNHEADLHTDSQYSSYPEDYFALLTLKRANCGGGESSLLTLPAILEELNYTDEGRRHLRVLEQTDFPFIVPNVFRQNPGGAPEFAFGPIIRPNEIRFRIDTVEKALAYDSGFCSDEQIAAFSFLKNLVRNSSSTMHFFLEDNDLIFINNKTMLHGRGSFTDTARHLLRIRMNKRGWEA